MIINKDSLQFLKDIKDFENDIIYCDPPYGLGSEVIIRTDGKPDYAKASDFMSKWDMPTGDYWEAWFKEAFRTLKHGGYCVMFGMDRQLVIPKYYAALAGFSERQSLYWYFISNFPKASDLSKMIDKNAGVEREVVGQNQWRGRQPNKRANEVSLYGAFNGENNTATEITSPTSSLAKKYNGYKYSISPLKQTNETILVFQKPYKSGSCLHDTLAYEAGDKEVCCGALDIDGGRCGTTTEIHAKSAEAAKGNGIYGEWGEMKTEMLNHGRYPAQTFCDKGTSEVLDRQSGELKTGGGNRNGKGTTELFTGLGDTGLERAFGKNIGGCSKILHHCDFEDDEHDLYFYCPKVNSNERNAGCEEMEETTLARSGGAQIAEEKGEEYLQEGHTGLNRISKVKNFHPTLKPISLNTRILKLFKTPNPQRICYPFAGVASEIIGGLKAGFTDYTACELSEEYIKIGEARIKYWSEQKEQNKLL